MHENNGQNKPITTDEIVKRIIGDDETPHLRQNLRTLMDSYFLNEDDLNGDQRYNIYATFLTLDNALQEINELQNSKNKISTKPS